MSTLLVNGCELGLFCPSLLHHKGKTTTTAYDYDWLYCCAGRLEATTSTIIPTTHDHYISLLPPLSLAHSLYIHYSHHQYQTTHQLYAHATETQHPAPAFAYCDDRSTENATPTVRYYCNTLLPHCSTTGLYHSLKPPSLVRNTPRALARTTIASPTWPHTPPPAQSACDQRSNEHCEPSSSAASHVPTRLLLAHHAASTRSAPWSPPTAMPALPWSACATRAHHPQVKAPTSAQ